MDTVHVEILRKQNEYLNKLLQATEHIAANKTMETLARAGFVPDISFHHNNDCLICNMLKQYARKIGKLLDV
jgi:hypothetical protein